MKARERFDDAAWSVTDRQRARIVAAAEAWLAANPNPAIEDIRFDAMLVAPGRMPRHIPAAFDASPLRSFPNAPVGFAWSAILARRRRIRAGVANDSAADFYRGKSLNIVVGHEAGTGYDFFGRTLARHITRHLPGNPGAVPQNMPGAGGLRAANWLYNVAAKDGTVVSVLAPETALKPIFGDAAASYEPAKFTWIGNMDESIATCTVSARSGITSLEQLFTREAVFGATGSRGADQQVRLCAGQLPRRQDQGGAGLQGLERSAHRAQPRRDRRRLRPLAFDAQDAMEGRHRQRPHPRAGAIRPEASSPTSRTPRTSTTMRSRTKIARSSTSPSARMCSAGR